VLRAKALAKLSNSIATADTKNAQETSNPRFKVMDNERRHPGAFLILETRQKRSADYADFTDRVKAIYGALHVATNVCGICEICGRSFENGLYGHTR